MLSGLLTSQPNDDESIGTSQKNLTDAPLPSFRGDCLSVNGTKTRLPRILSRTYSSSRLYAPPRISCRRHSLCNDGRLLVRSDQSETVSLLPGYLRIPACACASVKASTWRILSKDYDLFCTAKDTDDLLLYKFELFY